MNNNNNKKTPHQTFEDMIHYIVFKWEGGDLVHTVAGDPGGTTKYGISQRANPNVDIANLTWEQAIEIYRDEYWTRIQGENWSPGIALIALDAAVNQGPGDAIEFLQVSARTSVDGIIGKNTIAAVKAKDKLDFIEEYAARRGEDYTEINRAQLNRFGLGWMRRLMDIYREALVADGL